MFPIKSEWIITAADTTRLPAYLTSVGGRARARARPPLGELLLSREADGWHISPMLHMIGMRSGRVGGGLLWTEGGGSVKNKQIKTKQNKNNSSKNLHTHVHPCPRWASKRGPRLLFQRASARPRPQQKTTPPPEATRPGWRPRPHQRPRPRRRPRQQTGIISIFPPTSLDGNETKTIFLAHLMI